MSRHSISQRLQALAHTYRQNLNLIQELQRFSNGSSEQPNETDERRIELTNQIHQDLKEAEDNLELLRQEVEDDTTSSSRRQNSAQVEERERNAATLSRLSEDFKSLRASFRRAQLQAKRNADATKRREREQLFADRTTDSTSATTQARQRKGQQQQQSQLTQDEIALNAANDVTRALRRTHDLMSGNLQQSAFAQQTLDESQEALKGLSESYGGTTDLLSNSRGLVKVLLRSQKSDTWFLMSSFYVLAVTLAWLFFRRILYGPLWWFVWQPGKLILWMLSMSLGAVFYGGGALNETIPSALSVGSTNSMGIPTNHPGVQMNDMPLPAKGAGRGGNNDPLSAPESPEMVESVGKMVEQSMNGQMTDSSMKTKEAVNTKKRMMEVEIERPIVKDEL